MQSRSVHVVLVDLGISHARNGMGLLSSCWSDCVIVYG